MCIRTALRASALAALVIGSCGGGEMSPAEALGYACEDSEPDAYFDAEGNITCPAEAPLWSDVDPDGFDSLPGIESLDLARLRPASKFTYLELYRAGSGVLARTGELCAGASDVPLCRKAFAALRDGEGELGNDGPPFFESVVLLVNRGQVSTRVTSVDALRAFVGDVDTIEEVALVVFALGYGRGTGQASIRRASDGWMLIVVDGVWDCEPIIEDRLLLEVTRNGRANVCRRQTGFVSCNGCI